MIKNETDKKIEHVCDISYLTEMVHGKNNLVKEIMEEFLMQISSELQSINEAVIKTNYPIIKNLAHSMKSSISIMGVSVLTPVLQEMEDLGAKETDIEKIKELNLTLNIICLQATKEIESIKHKYV